MTDTLTDADLDALVKSIREYHRQGASGLIRDLREALAAITQLRTERDAAVADNAAILFALHLVAGCYRESGASDETTRWMADVFFMEQSDHPGAALLARLTEAEARNERLEAGLTEIIDLTVYKEGPDWVSRLAYRILDALDAEVRDD